MVKLHCAGCGDQLRRTTIFHRGVIRADVVDVQYRHTTRRWDNRYRPDTITRARIFHRFATARARAVPGKGHAAFWAAYYAFKA